MTQRKVSRILFSNKNHNLGICKVKKLIEENKITAYKDLEGMWRTGMWLFLEEDVMKYILENKISQSDIKKSFKEAQRRYWSIRRRDLNLRKSKSKALCKGLYLQEKAPRMIYKDLFLTEPEDSANDS